MKKIKAIGLFSGGLDSILAIKLMLQEKIYVYAYNLKTVFWGGRGAGNLSPRKIAERLGINFEEEEVSSEYLEIVKNPKHGYGSNMNPCIDCKVFFMQKAKEYMERIGGSFIFTGEVLGQRPMTQTRDMLYKIPRLAGVSDICLRPLSALLLEPTLPEREGWVNRENLLAISGRGRKDQIRLAEEFAITEYPAPAGGCLLTEPNFSERLRDLFSNQKNFNINDILLLKTGRHFRFSQEVKCIVGRNENDNLIIANLTSEGDVLFELEDIPSPLVLLRGEGCEGYINEAATLCKRYSDAKNIPQIPVKYWIVSDDMTKKEIVVSNVPESFMRETLI